MVAKAVVNSGRWTAADIPDQTGKVVVVTGANSGLGLETSRELARRGAHVVMACRTESKAQAAIEDIRSEQAGASLEFLALDLSDLSSIQGFAEAFLAKHKALDVLCNNAGVMALPYRTTADGFEMQIGTNHMGHFALAGRLLPVLLDTPDARIVTVSSLAHKGGKIRFHDLHWQKSYSKWMAYCQSKLANLLFAFELQRKLEAKGAALLSLASHPGYTSTNLQKAASQMKGSKFGERLWGWINGLFAMPTAQGALTNLYASTAEGLKGGDFIGPDGFGEYKGYPTKVKAMAKAHDPDVARRLWEVSVEATGVDYAAL